MGSCLGSAKITKQDIRDLMMMLVIVDRRKGFHHCSIVLHTCGN